MDLKQLHYFTAVAEAGSFTQAARQLHITQPSLSKMVRLLEEELGVQLIDRSAKQIALTDAGWTILRSAKQVLQSVEHMTSELEEVVTLKKGTLRLGIPPMIGGYFLPSIIEKFLSNYPQIQLHVIEQGGKSLEQDVLHGDLDFSMVILPVKEEEQFHIVPCMHENLQLVVHVQHPLAQLESVSLAQLEQEAFIMFRNDFTLHHLIIEHCQRAGFTPRIVLESSQWDFMTEMVAAKYGVTLLPEGISKQLDPRRFAAIPIRQPVIPWQLSMVWRKDKYLSFAAREWIRVVQAELSGLS
ncbi:DNA-binding transcriptional LysR family regulator [Paenibacillus phyllosphaerae]|uniref:DNA-binding transcriptional LysR family regulator n=1 Tax=Paenibacillus phyllosphaerae TaxID=274593 RepID=A0A7W5B560_9BACL|nr:LysR family transcriptional regulator [Paenibacillus phyllosphaerae]MBB3114607.1 DNA-binding transcriptional LysR family regulator [Paenibacillus phyllosphaerae]